MFFGVDLGPVKHRLGINLDRDRVTHTLDQRTRARTKYGIPYISRWKVEIQNVSREISWQDLKDFCFNKTGVRPSRADINQDKRIGTLCCTTEKELRSVIHKLNGAHLKGKSLKAVDISDHKSDEGRKILRKSSDIRHSGKPRTNAHRSDSHRSDRHKSERSSDTHRKNHHTSDRKRSDHPPSTNPRSHEEPKVIIHQPNGDRVITERIGNLDEYNTGDEGHLSETEQPYFKRDRKSSRSVEEGGRSHRSRRENGHADRKTNTVYKSSVSHKTRWRIRVENLSSEVSWQGLKDIIRPYAEVKYCDAHVPIEGIGNVHVSTEEGLHNVINKMNNSDIKGMIARFVDDSSKDDESAELVKRSRSRSPHRKRSSKSKGNETSKRSKSK